MVRAFLSFLDFTRIGLILFHFSLDLEESIDQEAVIEVTLQ